MKLLARRLLAAAAVTALMALSTVPVDPAKPPTDADKVWMLPAHPPAPTDNQPNAARVELGMMLFFDPRLSRAGNMSCATCHNPLLGWSDALPTARGVNSKILGRATPTVVNTAYNSIQMWDGRKASLEDQAMGPMQAAEEMNADLERVFVWMQTNAGYRTAFAKAYPGEPIGAASFSKAIASYERTIVSRESPFDRWLGGEHNAMTSQQVRGFRLFTDPNKGNCAICHQAPNFTDNGFHNVGLASHGNEDADMGRFKVRPVQRMRGAFKTPTLRDIEMTAPYFHDGSAATLMDVVEHYVRGGDVKTDLSPDMKPLTLSAQEKEDLVAFMRALTSPRKTVNLPPLPQ